MFSCFQIYCTLSFHIVGCIKGSSAICRNSYICLLYTSDAADDLLCVDLGGRRLFKKKKHNDNWSRSPRRHKNWKTSV